MECKRCGAPIRWVASSTSKSFMPVDREKVANGNLELMEDRRTVRVVTPDPAVKRYVCHYATCPNAGEFRARKSSNAPVRTLPPGTNSDAPNVGGVPAGPGVGRVGSIGRGRAGISGAGDTGDSDSHAPGHTLPLPWGIK